MQYLRSGDFSLALLFSPGGNDSLAGLDRVTGHRLGTTGRVAHRLSRAALPRRYGPVSIALAQAAEALAPGTRTVEARPATVRHAVRLDTFHMSGLGGTVVIGSVVTDLPAAACGLSFAAAARQRRTAGSSRSQRLRVRRRLPPASARVPAARRQDGGAPCGLGARSRCPLADSGSAAVDAPSALGGGGRGGRGRGGGSTALSRGSVK